MNPSATANMNAAGEGTRANYLIEFIGGKNIFKHDFKRYNKINKETLILCNINGLIFMFVLYNKPLSVIYEFVPHNRIFLIIYNNY